MAFAIIWSTVWLLRRLQHAVADSIAIGIARVAWLWPTKARRNIIRNAAAAIGRLDSDPAAIRTARRAWEHQALNYVDNMRVISESAERVLARTEVIGLEHLQQALAAGRGAIIASAHLGNVDFGGHATVLRGVPAVAVVQDIRSERLFHLLNDVRLRFGGELVRARPGAIGDLQRLLRQDRAVGFTCDWDSLGSGIPVPFLGRTLRMPVGPPMLAIRTRAPVVPGFVVRLPGRHYRVHYEPPLEFERTGFFRQDLARLAEAIGRAVERYIRQFPDQWCCFQNVWVDQEPHPLGLSTVVDPAG